MRQIIGWIGYASSSARPSIVGVEPSVGDPPSAIDMCVRRNRFRGLNQEVEEMRASRALAHRLLCKFATFLTRLGLASLHAESQRSH